MSGQFSNYAKRLLTGSGAAMVGWLRAATGAVLRTMADKASDIVNVRDFGAKLDNATDDRAAIQKAIDYLRSVGGGTLDFGSLGTNNCRIGAPLRWCGNLTLVGRARILPTAGFSSAGVTFPTWGTEVVQTYSCLAYFNDGTHADDPTNFGYSGLRIGRDIIFDGQYHTQAASGIIVEGMTDYTIEAGFTQFLSLGVWMKFYCWGGAVRSYITNCRTACLKLGPASNGIDLRGLKLYGLNDTPTYNMIIDGDNNGIDLSGAFIEKSVNQILWTGAPGPSTISGIDFEICSGTAIHVDGTGTAGRAAGPITITGCFLEAGVNAVKATNAIIIVQGSRVRSTPLAFKTVGAAARIYDIGNVIEATVTARSDGNVITDSVLPNQRQVSNFLPYADTPYQNGYSIENFAYSYGAALQTSSLAFDSSLQDVGTQRMLTSSTWQTREMRNGAIFGSLGLVLNYRTGAKNVEPLEDATHSLGTAAKRWNTIYGNTIMFAAGVGVGVGPVNNGEFTLQFTSNTQISIKAKGSDGVVRTANLALA